MAQAIVADLLAHIAANTIQVLHEPEKKITWIDSLKAIRQTSAGDEQLGLLIDNVVKLLSGESMQHLHPELINAYQECWTNIVNATRDGEKEPPSSEDKLRLCLETLNRTTDPSQRVPLLHEALNLVDPGKDAQLWAQLHVSLGQGLTQLANGDRRQNLEDAIASLRQALHVFTRETAPNDWAYVTMCLANALDMRIAGDRGQNVEDAIAAYREVLEVYTRESSPAQWALTMMNLGIALHNRQAGDAAQNVEQSLNALNDAASIITPESNLRTWIDLKVNTANAYLKRIQGDRRENLEWAALHASQALSAISQQHAPALWVTVAINLAGILSKRIAGTPLENLEQGRRLLLAAEKMFNPARAPLEWLRLSLVLNEILQKTVPQLRDDDVKRAAVIKDMCDRIWSLYGRTGESPAVLEPARLSFQLGADHTPTNSPDLGLYLIRLGILLEDTAKQSNDIHDLDNAIAAYEKAVQVTPGTKQLARNLNSLSLALAVRYDWLGELEDLRKSVDNLKQAISLSSEDSQDGLIFLRNMAVRAERLYEATKDPAALQDLADCLSRIIELSQDVEDQIDAHGKLGFCWMERYARSKASTDLDSAVEEYEKGTELVQEVGTRHGLFAAAGTARHTRFTLRRDLKDIEVAASHFAEADRRAADHAPEKVIILNNAGSTNALLFDLTSDPHFLDAAIGFLIRIPALQSTHELVATNSARIAELYRKRYELTHDPADLRAVLQHESQYADTLFPDAAGREYELIKICRDYAILFDRIESIAELESAIRFARALRDVASGLDMRLVAFTMLAHFLLRRWRLAGDLADLQEALQTARDAEAICPDGSELRTTVSALLAETLKALYEKTGTAEYQQESAAMFDELRVRVDAGDTADTYVYTSIGHAAADRFANLGDLHDLERSLEYHKKAIDVYPQSPKSAGLYTNLGNVFSDLYGATGSLQYLNEAIRAWAEAVRLSTSDSPYHSTRLNNLGSGWLLLYRHSRDPEALDHAVQLTRESVAITGPGAINLAVHLSYFGQSLLARYELVRDMADLNEAVDVLEKGLTLVRPDTVVYFQLITSLGQSLRLQSEATGKLELLSRSIETLSRAVETMLQTSRFFPDIAAVLGTNYQILHERDNGEVSRESMEQSYRRACQSGIPHRLDIVLNCSQWWGDWAFARKEWATAGEAYGYGIEALGKLYQTQVLRSEKEAWLSEAQRIHTRAAYAWAQAGQAAHAVEVLEAGRARLLVEVLERHRSELIRLPELGHAEIFRKYTHAIERLAYLERQELELEQKSGKTDVAAEIASARRDLEETVAAIQQIRGYEHLFAAPSMEQIQTIYHSLQANARRPAIVVYLLVVSWGGMAIILNKERIEPVPFDLTESELNSLMMSEDDNKHAGGYLTLQFAAHPNQGVLDHVIEILSSKLMQPVAAHLPDTGSADSESLPMLMLVPTGRLSLLPLHAIACGIDGGSGTLLDRFDVAFIPSLRSLNHCIEKLDSLPKATPALCAVGNPLPMPQGFAPLQFARAEVEEIATQFAGPNTLLCEERAQRKDVEACLDSAPCLHFSCHGLFDAHDAMLSGILLSGGERFTLRDLVTGPALTKPRLVVLSACQTAITEFNVLPEEAIGLPSGFLQAGLPGVVGSLWPVQEISTALLMIQFHRYHLHGDPPQQVPPLTPMRALRKAQLWLRDLTNAQLADMFYRYRKAASQHAGGIPLQLAQSQFQNFALSSAKERPYSHPYYWAAFAYFGI